MTMEILAGIGARFPETKYMGSKQRLLPFIRQNLAPLNFERVLDAFSGSGCVAYLFKQMGRQVDANDFMRFCYHITNATIANDDITLSTDEVAKLLAPNKKAAEFIRETFHGLYFDDEECALLDSLWANIALLKNEFKRSLAFASVCRACMKKRPRGLFTFTGHKGWDQRRDLKIRMEQQFIEAVSLFNNAVFSNGRQNRAFNHDVFELDPSGIDLVYLDPPYISRYSDCDYTRRYHFVEGYCHYWRGLEIMQDTRTKKIRSYETPFSTKSEADNAFRRLFHHFRRSTLVVSYSSNGIPDRQGLVRMLNEVKKKVLVYEMRHRYHHGNQAHKVGDNKNQVEEYLFIGT